MKEMRKFVPLALIAMGDIRSKRSCALEPDRESVYICYAYDVGFFSSGKSTIKTFELVHSRRPHRNLIVRVDECGKDFDMALADTVPSKSHPQKAINLPGRGLARGALSWIKKWMPFVDDSAKYNGVKSAYSEEQYVSFEHTKRRIDSGAYDNHTIVVNGVDEIRSKLAKLL